MATKKTVDKPASEPKEGYVTIRLFKDAHRYKDDLTVGVNGKFWQIKRGIPVDVPECVAEVIENALAQQQAASDMADQLQMEYLKKREALE